MKYISILDYGCGNILSIKRAIEKIGFKSLVTKNEKEIFDSNFIILPGVGSFKNAMDLIKKNELDKVIKNAIYNKEMPFLGICLGMQLLFSKSYEENLTQGLNIINGDVVSIKSKKKSQIKVPHIKWSTVKTINEENKFLKPDIDQKSFYFVHSYIAETSNKNETIATAEYNDIIIPSVVKNKNVIGCQFHPEKSGENGINLLSTIIKKYV
tara:strand:+ start:1549 stop:2181 length:633 start_codon:yes stop_codon:yes gene_type:complete